MTNEQFDILRDWIETRVALTIKAHENKHHDLMVRECLAAMRACDATARAHLVTKVSAPIIAFPEKLVSEERARIAASLTRTMQQSLPGGRLDDSSYENVERALDEAGAPLRQGERWLSLHERITALGVMKKRALWRNGCDQTVPEALRFLAKHDRPSGGEQRFNAAHLLQLAEEIEAVARESVLGSGV